MPKCKGKKSYRNTGRKSMATKKGKAAGKKTAMKAKGRKKY